MKNRILYIFVIALSTLNAPHCQNLNWIVGNNSINFNDPPPLQAQALPTPSGPNVYEGQQARATHNAYHNPVTGQLLFFIVDGIIYDKDGYIIDDLIANSASGENILGFAETVIVPDPGNCSRYYIFLGSWPYLEQPTYQAKAYFAVLDLSLPRVNFHTNRMGALVEGFISGQNNIAYNLITSLVPNGQHYNTLVHAPIHIACTPKLADGSHLLVVQMGTMVNYNFKISSSGISYVFDSALSVEQFMPASQVYTSNQNLTSNFSFTRSELELFQKPNGSFTIIGNYKGGVQIFNNPNQDFEAYETIYKYDINPQTLWPIQGTYQEYTHRVVGNPSSITSKIKGFELSPDKRYLYFTSTATSALPKSVHCLDMNTFQLVNLPIIPNVNHLRYSRIESAANGSMYFAASDGLYVLNTPNNPSTASISLQVPIASNLADMYQNSVPSWQDDYGQYLLPDQMDFDPNCQVGCYALNCAQNPSEVACCQLYGSGNLFSPNQDNYVVTSSATWAPGASLNPFGSVNGEVEFLGDLIIRPGASLTVNGMTLKFAPNTRILIERDPSAVVPSAKLYLRNSLLTSNAACGSCHLWSGIEVQGHNFLGQNDPNNAANINPMQGFLEVTSSTIENAYFGALTGRIVVPDQIGQGIWQITSGGIIQTKNAVFKNNRHDVYFMPYTHGSRSFFDFTQFITTEDLKLEENQMNELKHAVLKEIRGVEFRSCLFKNYADVDAVGFLRNDGKPRGIGINTFNAHFLAQGSEFSQLDYGVYAESSNSSMPYTVTECNFNKNFTGIFAQGVINATMTKNVFEVYKVPASGLFVSETIGIRFMGCNRYIVEENIFMDGMPSYQVNAHNYGIEVRSSGLNSNVIENNQFAGLHSGGISRGVNASNYLLPDTQLRGLQWLCNSFQNMRNNDLWVRSGRIAPWQGECTSLNTSPAGNKFSPVSPSGHFHYRLSAASPPIRYYYFNELHAMPTSISPTVQLWQCQAEEYIRVCGRLIKVDESGLAPAGLVELRDSLINQKSTIQAVIDFGATDSLVQQVLLPYLSDEEKRDLLKNNDIVVSDAVLIKYMNSNPPASMLYQVLVHNSPLSPKLIHYMMQESGLPSGMKQQVLFIQNGLSDYESKMQYLQYLNLEIQTVENKIMQIYLADSTGLYTPEDFKNLFEQKPHHEFSDLHELFTAYLYARDENKADSINTLLKQLNTDLEFSILSDLAVNSLTSDYFTILNNDSALIPQLENMATLLDDQYGPQARSILTGVLGYTFSYPLDDPVEPRNQLNFDTSYDGSTLETVSIFPNPAQDHFFIVFDENADVSQTREVKVYDLSGVLQFTSEMKANDYVLEVKTENMAKGMYLVVISANGKDISTQKVAVR